MQQFGIQGIPAVFAVVAGQALPLFQGAAGEAQIRGTLDQLVEVAEQRFGLTGLTVDPDAESGSAPAAHTRYRQGPTTRSWRPLCRPWTRVTSAVPYRRTRTC